MLALRRNVTEDRNEGFRSHRRTAARWDSSVGTQRSIGVLRQAAGAVGSSQVWKEGMGEWRPIRFGLSLSGAVAYGWLPAGPSV